MEKICVNCGYSMSRVGKFGIECWRWVPAGGDEFKPAEEIVRLDHRCSKWKPMTEQQLAGLEGRTA